MNTFAISGLLIIVVTFPLFILLLSRGKTNAAKVYSLSVLAVALWGVGSFLGATATTEYQALKIWKITMIPVYFIPTFLFHTALLIRGRLIKWLLVLVYAQAFLFGILSFNGKLFASIEFKFDSFYYPMANTLFLCAFLMWLTVISLTYYYLFIYYKDSYPENKKSIFFLLIAIIIGFGGGIPNFFPSFNINIYPYGNFLIPFFTITMMYPILRYQFLNIDLLIKKSIVYSFLITGTSLFYLLIVVILEQLIKEFIGYRSTIISILAACILGALFVPIRNRFQSFIDTYFFKGTQIQIAEENELLRQELVRAEKLKAVSTLASGIAHEIKNPLTAIRTFTEFLPDKKSDPEFLDKFSKIVGHEVDRIDDLVHQLLDFAKPSPPQPVNTDIHKLIDETLDFLNNNFIKQSIKISKGYARENVYLDIDHNQIKQALLNIILNAIDAMPKGGTLSVKTEKTTEKIRIFIADTGEGISKRDLAHIFDPFFTKKDGGTGLGLAITHEIIKTHNGRITVKSEPGKGAEFKIELPFAGSLG